MKIKKVNLITEEARSVQGVNFSNSTEDQFPYVESALNTLDNNFNWWKENWPALEQLIAQQLNKATGENQEKGQVTISSRFTVFHGHDDNDTNVVWTGPSIVYTFAGTSGTVVKSIKDAFGGIYKGKKMFANNNDLIVLFG